MKIIIDGYENLVMPEENETLGELLIQLDDWIRKNKRIAFGGLKKEEEGAFVDELVEFNKEYFKPFMLKYHKKFEKIWKEEMAKK